MLLIILILKGIHIPILMNPFLCTCINNCLKGTADHFDFILHPEYFLIHEKGDPSVQNYNICNELFSLL